MGGGCLFTFFTSIVQLATVTISTEPYSSYSPQRGVGGIANFIGTTKSVCHEAMRVGPMTCHQLLRTIKCFPNTVSNSEASKQKICGIFDRFAKNVF